MYSRSMKGSLIATTSTFLEVKAARVTRRPMRPNLKSEQFSFLVWPQDGVATPQNCLSRRLEVIHTFHFGGLQWNVGENVYHYHLLIDTLKLKKSLKSYNCCYCISPNPGHIHALLVGTTPQLRTTETSAEQKAKVQEE